MASYRETRVVFKNATKISLNHRFTNIMKTRPTVDVTLQSANQKKASERNRRLAQQMESRLGVAAEPGAPSKPSIKSRLGAARRKLRDQNKMRTQSNRSVASRLGKRPVKPKRGGRQTANSRPGKSRQQQEATKPGNVRGLNTRGRGRGRMTRGGAKVNKDTLDQQIDLYMSKTKSSMDAELDAYSAAKTAVADE